MDPPPLPSGQSLVLVVEYQVIVSSDELLAVNCSGIIV